MTDPWGLDEPPTLPSPLPPLPPRLARMAALTEPVLDPDPVEWAFPRPEELPEVEALMSGGWRPLDGQQRHALMPAVWPTELRCWVPNRLPAITQVTDGTGPRIIPAAVEPVRDSWWVSHLETVIADAGYPPPPDGRIWLLKSPISWLGTDVVLDLINRRAEELGCYQHEPAPIFAAATIQLLGWSDDELRSWWTGPDKEAAIAWERVGRVGEDAASVVRRGLQPADLERLSGLTESEALSWCRVVGGTGRSAVDRVLFWRSVGFDTPPTVPLSRLHRLPEDDIRAWLGAGFSLEWMTELLGLPLDQAISWRDNGYSTTEIGELLRADVTITPAEATEFAVAGINGTRRLEWIANGFTAADAAAYTGSDVQPNEARVWRSLGRGPADVAPGQQLPPDYQRGGWVSLGNVGLRDVEHQVQDPPGTRGNRARQAAEQAARLRAASRPDPRTDI